MINVFRTRVKSWNSMWWIVLVAFVIGQYSRRAPTRSEQTVMKVNGKAVTGADISYSFAALKRYMDYFAQVYGMAMPIKDLQERAIKKCINEKLLDAIVESAHFALDSDYFKDQLVMTLPNALIEPDGKVNIALYKQYLASMHLTVETYEDRVAEELKRAEVSELIKNSGYVTDAFMKDMLGQELKKSFVIVKFPLNHYLHEVQKGAQSEEAFENYYKANKEAYRIEDKSKALYCMVDTEHYGKAVEVDQEAIERFYTKNKETMFKTPLQLKVRRILFAVQSDATSDEIKSLQKKAHEVLVLAQKGDDFASLAKKYSQDTGSALQGGLLDPFSRGTHEQKFESVAFRLKEKGQISDVFRSEQGFEIIKLEERTPSSEKPLGAVKSEIIEAIKLRKSRNQFQNDLDALMRAVREDKEVFNVFAQEHGLKLVESEWLGVSSEKPATFEFALASKLVAKAKQGGIFGTFVHEGKTIIFLRTGFEKSFIPSFSVVKGRVQSDYEHKEALRLAQAAVRKARAELLVSKRSLEEFAKEQELKSFTTHMVTKEHAKLEGKPAEGLFEKAYELNDSSLLLEASHGDDFYLIQVEKIEELDSSREQEIFEKNFKLENKQVGDMNYQGFIASLLRTARIENNSSLGASAGADYSDLQDE